MSADQFEVGRDEYKLTINTRIVGSEIRQEVESVSGVIYRCILQTRDVQIRKALIDMGWTPPKDEKP